MTKRKAPGAEEISLYTPEEAARLLKLHPQTLAAWRMGKAGVVLPFVKIGRAVRYRHEDIIAFIELNSFTNNSQASS